jgi:branched-chain amino acid transport system ATP-binding protein
MSALLALSGLRAGYGPIEALRGIDLTVADGEVVALIGANGAGKSTLLMTVCGVVHPHAGSIVFAGRDITGLPTEQIVRGGISQVPESRRIFARMTVHENLQLGALVADPDNFAADLKRVYALFPILDERAGQRAGTLSGGEQQMLAIGRALMARPRLLLLDEPTLGLAPLIARRILEVVREINQAGTTVLLVEQNAYQALKIADRGYVLANGAVALSGPGAELLANPEVQSAYLEGGALR